MGWEDRNYGSKGGGGGFRGFMGRVFGDGENPLAWSIPLYTLFDIQVKIHLFFVIYIVAELIMSVVGASLGPTYRIMMLGSLFGIVLLHEYGHCVACRLVQGEADQILLWPLGGLAFCIPPNTWQANLITTIGGPLVNVILVPFFAALVLLAGGSPSNLVFNPFDLGFVLGGFGSMILQLAWIAYFINLILLAFNVLLPMYPLDGGRILHAILWARLGQHKAQHLSIKTGLVIGVCLAIFGLVSNQSVLVGVAGFGLITCWLERRRMQFMSDTSSIPGYDFSKGHQGMPDADQDRGPSRVERKREARAAKEQAEVDAILDKVAKHGLHALSSREKRMLKRATERQRRA